jgi:ferredoxin
MRVIGISAEGFPETKKDAFRLCINCGYCVDICIKAALTHIVRRRTADSAAAIRRYEAAVKRYERCKKEQKVEGKLK